MRWNPILLALYVGTHVLTASSAEARQDRCVCVIDQEEVKTWYRTNLFDKSRPYYSVFTDVPQAFSPYVKQKCKPGDLMVLRDPKREAGWDYGPRGSRVPYTWEKIIDQRSMEEFCDLMAIRKLETGDYACTIDRGL